MKLLREITKEEVEFICKLCGEPFISYMVNDNNKWDSFGLEIQINTTSTLHNSRYDSYLRIFKNGTVELSRNTGGWNGMSEERINAMLVTDYLKERGYSFFV